MGNLSSCTTGLLMSSSTPQQVPPMVRVLLVDGSVLKLKAPMKVSKLLVEYPNHVICSLASLKPGLHALSSLLPDENLQLGGLYLLLPSRSATHAQKAQSTACKSELAMRKRALNESFLQKKMGAHDQRRPSSTLPTKKSNLDFDSSSVESSRNGDLGMGFSSSARELNRKHEVGRQNTSELAQSSQNIPAKAAWRRRREGEKEKDDRSAGFVSQHTNVVNGDLCRVRRLCNTPELQRAYLSLLLRRSTSWTPRLQPINERR